MQTKHTQGKWIANMNTFKVFDKQGYLIADCKTTLKTEDANTILIASAPELLEALEHLIKYCNIIPNSTCPSDLSPYGNAVSIVRRLTGVNADRVSPPVELSTAEVMEIATGKTPKPAIFPLNTDCQKLIKQLSDGGILNLLNEALVELTGNESRAEMEAILQSKVNDETIDEVLIIIELDSE